MCRQMCKLFRSYELSRYCSSIQDAVVSQSEVYAVTFPLVRPGSPGSTEMRPLLEYFLSGAKKNDIEKALCTK